ncbi:MAG: hypothetical protein J6S85_20910 [Methanobrevibacter sp.]|nr:hypothetical protein [Methanobrevibacter sp.]
MKVTLISHEQAAFDSFTAHFEKIKETDNEIICKCPVCGSKKLYISVGSNSGINNILLNCFHNCDYKDILSAAGLEPKELYLTKAKRLTKDNCTFKREHVYTDKDGAPLFRKTIYKYHTFWEYNGKQKFPNDKETFWEQYDPNTGEYKKGGSCKVLYHLDKLRGDTVYIPEGEKDVETLESMGFIATTNGGGAAEDWSKKGYLKQLDGIKNAVILADNDKAGTDHARKVARYLTGGGIACKIIEAPAIYAEVQQKGDISDIKEALGADKTKEQLTNAVNAAELYQITAEEQEAAKAPERLKVDNPYNADGLGKLTITNLKAALTAMDIHLKRNLITHEIDYSGTGIKGIDLCGIGSILPTMLYDELQFYLKGCNIEKIGNMISAMSFHKEYEYNPILETIDGTKWDGKDHFSKLCELATIDPEDKLSQAIFKKWLMQCYCGLHNDPENPFSLDNVLVFVGKQGKGKTRLLEKLSLSRKYFGEGAAMDPRDKDSVIQITSCWITELGEIGSTMKKEINALKAFISNATDKYRPPYGRGQVIYPRTTSFCGTTNDIDYLIDETGNRRFATVQLQDDKVIDVKSKEFKEFNTLQLWAQIAAIVNDEIKAGGSYASVFRLNDEESAELEQRNTQHTKQLKGEQEVIDILSAANNNPPFIITVYKYITVTEFKNHYSELKNYSSVQIGKVLKKLGIEPKFIKSYGQTNKTYNLPLRQSNIGQAEQSSI